MKKKLSSTKKSTSRKYDYSEDDKCPCKKTGLSSLLQPVLSNYLKSQSSQGSFWKKFEKTVKKSKILIFPRVIIVLAKQIGIATHTG